MLISAWLNDQKDKHFGIEFTANKRWYKINKVVVGCYDQASRNIRSGSNADDIKKLVYKLCSTN
ncbi:hypothetical protein Ahy_B01g052892 [Arachis hypogaea]|uniref:Uncharacterized protein n=1 Tax=Arachis hypogaea TaxID=3818 RepID=A0A445AQS2_ARAHY|nr:hypothetical protein Ahy_B01g052892 [Arachis hypogaea]